MTPQAIRKKSAEFAISNINSQKTLFKEWGVLGDWNNPYLTMRKFRSARKHDIQIPDNDFQVNENIR